MGKILIIKSADFSTNAVDTVPTSKVLTLDDFVVREGHFLNQEGIVTYSTGTSGCDTPISVYAGEKVTITARLDNSTWLAFTNKALANSKTGEEITVSTPVNLPAGDSITLTIPSNAQYLYVLKSVVDNDRFPSYIYILQCNL